ncbi:hypothetical protein Tco_0914513 [Tanacetum coccineum]
MSVLRRSDSLNLLDHRYKRQCCSPTPAKSDSSPHAHTQAFKVEFCQLEKESRIIKAIHGEEGNHGKLNKSSFSSTWMDIVCDLTKLKNQGIDLLGLIKKNVGKSEDTLFWKGDITFIIDFHESTR